MNIQAQREIRFGMIALVITGLLYVLSVIVRGPLDPDSAKLMRAVLTPNFVPGVIIGLVGVPFNVYGVFGVYRYLTLHKDSLIAFLAVLLAPLGLVWVLPFVTFLSVNVPVIAALYQQGNQEVLAVFDATFSNPFGLGLLGATSLASLIGTLLFAFALWRDDRLPKWVAVMWPIKGILLLVSGPGLYATEMLGVVLALIVSCALAWKAWQEPVLAATPAPA